MGTRVVVDVVDAAGLFEVGACVVDVVAVGFGEIVARSLVVVGPSATGAEVVPGAGGSVAAVTGGRRVVGGGRVVVVVVVGGGIAADGETLGWAWLPNANASMLPAAG